MENLCPLCGGQLQTADLLSAHVQHCLDKADQAAAAAADAAPPSVPPAAIPLHPKPGGGRLRGLFGRNSMRLGHAAQNANVERQYKRLRKAIAETSLSLCTKREAIQLAALALRIDIAAEERKSKKPEEVIDLYRQEKFKQSHLSQYYAAHWLAQGDPLELTTELWNELDLLQESLAGKYGREVDQRLMGEYVAQCQALPFFGMTIFSLLEWRVKESSKKRAADQTNTRTISKSAPTEEAAAFVDDGASQFKGKGKTKIKYEKVPMCLGITRDCSLIKIDERNEIEMAWRITQIKAYSLLLRDGREQQKLSRLTPNDFILSLDFGECFPHQIQLINRQPKGLLSKSPRHKLRDNAIIHLADDAEDSIRLIFTQIHSYIQETSGLVQEERRRMQERLASYGLQERDVVGDGNCQLRAISHQLFQTEDRHVEVRKAVVKWLRGNANYAVREASTGRVISRLIDFLEKDYHRSWNDYCSYMGRDASWGDHMTLIATAEVYSVNIWILSSVDITNEQGEASEPWTMIKPQLSSARQGTLVRLGHWHEKHFSSLVPASS